MCDNEGKPFFVQEDVVKCGNDAIDIRFKTLLKVKRITFAEFYNHHSISLDRSYASKIRRGLIIPPLSLRLKIAKFFDVDTAVIWKPSDIDYENYMEILKEEK